MSMELSEKVRKAIRNVPNFPKEGIQFKDITPILSEPKLVTEILDYWENLYRSQPIDAIIGIESRGFMLGAALAERLQKPFIPIRKVGKLPYETVTFKYDLEYGSSEVEMHKDALKPNWKVLIHDDLLATGGTAMAAAELTKKMNAQVHGYCFLVELAFLEGRERIESYSKNVDSLSIFY